MKTKQIAGTVVLMMVTVCFGWAQQRFDMIVRQDFFAGFAGNKEALARAMKVTEDTLASNPNHAEARVWHGSGILYSSGEAFRNGDPQTGMKLWQQALDEMEQAVRLAPNNPGVVIPRGATLITASRFVPPNLGAPILQTGVSDFEHVLKLQEGKFPQLSVHARGELLTGLADGWSRLGDNNKAREYFERIARDLKGSVYEQKANAWLENKPEAKAPGFFNCSGCHVR
jgi:tetratricopeptide (TPR) repeat protein